MCIRNYKLIWKSMMWWGGDYLVEISGRYLNVYGQGALRFIDRPWNPVKAGDVTHVRFHYVNFNSLSCVLGRLKQRWESFCVFTFTRYMPKTSFIIQLCDNRLLYKIQKILIIYDKIYIASYFWLSLRFSIEDPVTYFSTGKQLFDIELFLEGLMSKLK